MISRIGDVEVARAVRNHPLRESQQGTDGRTAVQQQTKRTVRNLAANHGGRSARRHRV